MEVRSLQRAGREVGRGLRLQSCRNSSRWRAMTHTRQLSSTPARSEEWKQHKPLGGYYEAILSSPIPPPTPPKAATPRISKDPEPSTATTPVEAPSPPSARESTSPKTSEEMEKIREETRARAAVVFGSPLVGPAEKKAERQAEVASKSTLIAGVLVPPKPDEPDNCCMSGCVNCVWDRYGDEVEEWAGAKREAAKMLRLEHEKGEGEATGRRGVVVEELAMSMDDDGGGRLVEPEEELYKDVPVAILEFMKTTKKLKERQMAAQLAGKS